MAGPRPKVTCQKDANTNPIILLPRTLSARCRGTQASGAAARRDRRMAEGLGLSERLQKNGEVRSLFVAQLNSDRGVFAFNFHV